jgi:hypothetical protein
MMNNIGDGLTDYYNKIVKGSDKQILTSEAPTIDIFVPDDEDAIGYLANAKAAELIADMLHESHHEDERLASITIVVHPMKQPLAGRSFDETTLTPITFITMTETATNTATATITKSIETTRTVTTTVEVTSEGCKPSTQWMATGGPTVTTNVEVLMTTTETATETTTVQPEVGLKKIFYDTNLVKPVDFEGVSGLETEALDSDDMLGSIDRLPTNINMVLVDPDSIKTPETPTIKDALLKLVARGAAAPAFIPSVRSMALGVVAVGGLVMAL